jgi:hypothetical protein
VVVGLVVVAVRPDRRGVCEWLSESGSFMLMCGSMVLFDSDDVSFSFGFALSEFLLNVF